MLWWWEAARSTAMNNVAFMLPSNQSSDRSEGSVLVQLQCTNCRSLNVQLKMGRKVVVQCLEALCTLGSISYSLLNGHHCSYYWQTGWYLL